MTLTGNALITDNKSDTIENIDELLRYMISQQGADPESELGLQLLLKTVRGAVISLKDV